MNAPLVSFCVMCHDQEAYIEEAFRAALAQTYEPLEVIVNDDASTDGSWEVIRRVAAEYAGPHKVILNRCETNVGVIRSFETLCSLASGELIVKADGDDVSYPNRAVALVEEWLKTDRKALFLSSAYDVIDKNGKIVATDQSYLAVRGRDDRSFADILFHKGGWHVGATMAINPVLFLGFPRVEQTDAFDDKIFVLRACFLSDHEDRIRMVSQSLVKYRREAGLSADMRRCSERNIAIHRQAYLDCRTVAGQEEKLPLIQRKVKWDEFYLELRFAPKWLRKVRAYARMWTVGVPLALLIRRLFYLLPSAADES